MQLRHIVFELDLEGPKVGEVLVEDANGNTLLEDGELAFLKLWVDNGDGKLNRSELQELSKYNIFLISTRTRLASSPRCGAWWMHPVMP